MPDHYGLQAGVLLLAGLIVCIAQFVWVPAAEAIVINLPNRATPRISIRVGAGGNRISTVEFTVPATDIGSDNPVTGIPSIRIRLVIRGPAASPVTGILSADSYSNPLTSNRGNTIPFSDISWTSSNGDIPSGTFTESTSQILATFQSSRQIIDTHTFTYANTGAVAEGVYAGRVVYTWAAP